MAPDGPEPLTNRQSDQSTSANGRNMSLKGELVKQCRLIDLPRTHHRFKSPPQGELNQRSPSASTVEFFNMG
jgi:hypothetical protein